MVEFTLPESMGPPVLFYYQLTNFYQNHRRYVASFNADQLKGKNLDGGSINGSTCDPLEYDDDNFLPIYPCGLIANSMFNDTFTSPQFLQGKPEDGNTVYAMENNTQIAWGSDKELYKKTTYKNTDVMPPPNWRDLFPKGYTDEAPIPDISDWQAFMVWMRTAGLPTFSKLYQRNNNQAMAAGTYRVLINSSELFICPLCPVPY
jgi:hypothetical protein